MVSAPITTLGPSASEKKCLKGSVHVVARLYFWLLALFLLSEESITWSFPMGRAYPEVGLFFFVLWPIPEEELDIHHAVVHLYLTGYRLALHR